MSDAGQEAARRWPQAVSSRIDHRYPVSALYEFSREAFVEGAAWQAGQGAEAKLARVRAFAEEGAKVADPALAASVGYAECASEILRILGEGHEVRPGSGDDRG